MADDVPSEFALPDGVHPFPHKHLTGIAGLQPWEIGFLLNEAEQWIALNRATAAGEVASAPRP